MMGEVRPTRSPLVLWLVVSLAIHVAVLLPALVQAMQQPASAGIMQANFEPDSIDKPDDPDEMQLGIEDSLASTMTWIGYDEYEEHLAELGRVEQAAFDREPPTPHQPDVESVAAAEPAQPVDDAEAANAQPEPEAPETDPVETVTETEVADAASSSAPERTMPIDPMAFMAALKEAFAVFQMTDSARPATAEALADAEEEADAEGEAEQSAKPAQVAKAVEQPPQPETPPPSEVVPPNPVADQSDRESDPASIVEVPLQDVKLGKPLAAKGLELKPARPKFTTLQLVTLAPCCNPLTTIEFTRDGRPLLAKIIESSGHELIDESVQASLYKWRASGDELSTLTGDQTITVEIRIILVNH